MTAVMTQKSPRERTVRSAALLFRERGVGGTGLREVVEHAGAPRGSLQYYFPGGKEQLLVEVERLARLGEDRLWVVHVGVDVAGGALGRAREQRAGVGEHQRVVVDVDDAGRRGQPLGDLVGVVGGRQARADVEELPYALLLDQVAARRQAVEQRAHDRAGLFVVRDVPEHADHQQRDRLGEVQRLGRLGDDRLGVVHVGVDVAGGALGRAGEQRAGVGEHQRVVVDVDDAGFRGQPLGDLVGVVGGRQARADVEELAYALLLDQVPHGAREELAAGARLVQLLGVVREELVARLAVGLEVVLAAQPVVPDPGGMRHGGVERVRACHERTVDLAFVAYRDPRHAQ